MYDCLSVHLNYQFKGGCVAQLHRCIYHYMKSLLQYITAISKKQSYNVTLKCTHALTYVIYSVISKAKNFQGISHGTVYLVV